MDQYIESGQMAEARQQRSRESQTRMIDAGWKLLKTRNWDDVSVADIAHEAGRSVGVFYQRFRSREDYLSILLDQWIRRGYVFLDESAATTPDEELVEVFVRGALRTVADNPNLWRAALTRALTDPESWEPFNALLERRVNLFIKRIEKSRGKALTKKERRQIGITFQATNSFINQAVLLDPGPAHVTDKDFLDVIVGLFRNGCAIDLP